MKNLNWKLYSVLLFIFSFSCTAQNKTVLNANEFEKSISNSNAVQVLDVRTPAEFFSGHIKNALQADWNDKEEFNRRIAFIDKNKPVYVYCLAGGRSSAAATKMRAGGYKDVYELEGGINAWKAADKPLEGKSNTPQISMDDFNIAISSKTVLVDFGATWCPPCKMMEPILKDLQTHNNGKFSLVKVDGSNDQDLLNFYKVKALPVFIIFKDGKQVWRKDGTATEKEIASHL